MYYLVLELIYYAKSCIDPKSESKAGEVNWHVGGGGGSQEREGIGRLREEEMTGSICRQRGDEQGWGGGVLMCVWEEDSFPTMRETYKVMK